MQVKWIELKPYYTYKTAYPKTEINVGISESVQNMEYNLVSEKIKRYSKNERNGNISIWLFAKYWLYYRPTEALKEAIRHKYGSHVYRVKYH